MSDGDLKPCGRHHWDGADCDACAASLIEPREPSRYRPDPPFRHELPRVTVVEVDGKRIRVGGVSHSAPAVTMYGPDGAPVAQASALADGEVLEAMGQLVDRDHPDEDAAAAAVSQRDATVHAERAQRDAQRRTLERLHAEVERLSDGALAVEVRRLNAEVGQLARHASQLEEERNDARAHAERAEHEIKRQTDRAAGLERSLVAERLRADRAERQATYSIDTAREATDDLKIKIAKRLGLQVPINRNPPYQAIALTDDALLSVVGDAGEAVKRAARLETSIESARSAWAQVTGALQLDPPARPDRVVETIRRLHRLAASTGADASWLARIEERLVRLEQPQPASPVYGAKGIPPRAAPATSYESGAEMLARLGTDGAAWAAAFAARFVDRDGLRADGGDLIAWFANAIEAGRTAGAARPEVDLIFDGPPPSGSTERGAYVGARLANGGELIPRHWTDRHDGTWVLRLSPPPPPIIEIERVDDF